MASTPETAPSPDGSSSTDDLTTPPSSPSPPSPAVSSPPAQSSPPPVPPQQESPPPAPAAASSNNPPPSPPQESTTPSPPPPSSNTDSSSQAFAQPSSPSGQSPSPPDQTQPSAPVLLPPPSFPTPASPSQASLPPPSDHSNHSGKPPPPSHEPPDSGPGRNAGSHGRAPAGKNNGEQHSGSLNTHLIAGLAAGIGAFVLLMIIVAIVSCARKKRKPAPLRNPMHYHDPSGKKGAGGADYYNGGRPSPMKWGMNGAVADEHAVKLPPPPGAFSPAGVGGIGGGGVDTLTTSSSGYSGPQGPALPPPSPVVALGFNKSTFGYDELAAATGGFSQANMIGQGGFGYVYKGVLPNGKEIAVKQLKSGSGQGEREFQAEVEIISRVHHRHLVSLVGYCIAGAQRILVYEFIANKTLEYHLYGKGLPVMDWETRLKITLGAAKGLAYLHEDCHPRIIHRDIKSANILLDNKFEAMVADFGLAKLSADNHTHVSTRVMGTFGYLAPEYASSGKLTEKSDVFSFGVMLLELITGRRPVDLTGQFMEDSLVDWARPILIRCLTEENYEELVDPRLENNYNSLEMARIVACASACTRHSAKTRPKMSQIVRGLEGDVSLEDLSQGVKPGQSMAFSSSDQNSSSSYSSDMRRFRRVALAGASDDFTTGAYSGATSEYGLNPSSSSSEGDEYSREMVITNTKPAANRHRINPAGTGTPPLR